MVRKLQYKMVNMRTYFLPRDYGRTLIQAPSKEVLDLKASLLSIPYTKWENALVIATLGRIRRIVIGNSPVPLSDTFSSSTDMLWSCCPSLHFFYVRQESTILCPHLDLGTTRKEIKGK